MSSSDLSELQRKTKTPVSDISAFSQNRKLVQHSPVITTRSRKLLEEQNLNKKTEFNPVTTKIHKLRQNQ